MMNEEITQPQAVALAALIRSLRLDSEGRPDWDASGIDTQIAACRTRGTAWDVAHAALYAAEDRTNRTPRVIALAGPHWTRGKPLGEGGPIRFTRCTEPGHGSFPAHNCSACRAEQIQGERPTTPEPSVSPERIAEIFERSGVQRIPART
jgi:hypothetical protein